ncbi:uncharacterized protein LOC134753444 [Cydia strobilella]|uniref:uncharacterized protein LOC134753444 n=1 Tax=Cydia strobilella TaxID=1100964 RepID=UPI003007E782
MLGITIRFLATGNTFRDMEFTEYRGRSTIGKIVREVCQAIWKSLLGKGIPSITKNLLEQIADEFFKNTNFPNCIGALDADEGLPLTNNIMRPYPGKHLTIQQRVFNYRLSRARRYVECTFGILANKWRIFHRPLNVQYNFATDIIKACGVIHNFVISRDGIKPSEELLIHDGFSDLHHSTNYISSTNPVNIRNEFCKYFSSDVGALTWQLSKI